MKFAYEVVQSDDDQFFPKHCFFLLNFKQITHGHANSHDLTRWLAFLQ